MIPEIHLYPDNFQNLMILHVLATHLKPFKYFLTC